MRKRGALLILGAGGHGKSVAEAALLSGKWKSILFVDDCWPHKKEIAGFPIIANMETISNIINEVSAAIPAVGNNKLRQIWFQQLKELSIPIASIVHPSAMVSSTALIGEGVAIMAGCVIGVDVNIDDGVIVNMGSSVDHDCHIGMFAHLSVGVKITGNKTVDSLNFLEAGSVITH